VSTTSGSPTLTSPPAKLGSQRFVLATVTSTGAHSGDRVGGGVTNGTASVTATSSAPDAGTTLPVPKTSIAPDRTGTGDDKRTWTIAPTLTGRVGVTGTRRGLTDVGFGYLRDPGRRMSEDGALKVTCKQLTALVIT
jgi:hypothetical protein